MITLNRQLWLIIISVVLVMFLCSILISTSSTIAQINQQVEVKNNDAANLLAQVLSEVEKDPVLLELFISGQFDSGYYEYIRLHSVDGNINIVREHTNSHQNVAPAWFERLVDIHAAPGFAHVADGWSQFGSVEVRSQTDLFIIEVWNSVKRFTFWSLIIAVVTGSISVLVQRIVTKPLNAVIEQAEGLGQKRFTMLALPKTLEYRRLVQAMNTLTQRVRDILALETDKLNALRAQLEHDSLTGLLNRDTLFAQLEALLGHSDRSQEHGICIIRIQNLNALNKEFGRVFVDELLKDIAKILEAIGKSRDFVYEGYFAARLNGSDFAVIAAAPLDFEALSAKIHAELDQLKQQKRLHEAQILSVSSLFSPQESRASVLMRSDSLLTKLESSESQLTFLHSNSLNTSPFLTAKDWYVALTTAIENDDVFFERFPVISLATGEIVHFEGMLRAKLKDNIHTAGSFLPWAQRLSLTDEVELAAIKSLLKVKNELPVSAVAIKLSYEFLSHSDNRKQLIALAKLTPELTIIVEVHESIVINNPEITQMYCSELKQSGFYLSLSSALNCFDKIPNIQQLGFDFIKFDSLLTNRAHESEEGLEVLRRYITLAHSLGAVAVAQGFQKEHSNSLLHALGIDAATGPGAIPAKR